MTEIKVIDIKKPEGVDTPPFKTVNEQLEEKEGGAFTAQISCGACGTFIAKPFSGFELKKLDLEAGSEIILKATCPRCKTNNQGKAKITPVVYRHPSSTT